LASRVDLLGTSLTLLVAALAIAFALGISLGTRAAQARAGRSGSLIWLISIAGSRFRPSFGDVLVRIQYRRPSPDLQLRR
jgi:ABC-type dipeptide/oligopeptide/nickel transport system permease component